MKMHWERGKESLIKCQICQLDCQNQAPAHEYRYQSYMQVDGNIVWHFNTSAILLLCVCVCGRLLPVSLYNCETQMKRILSLGCAFVEYPIQSKRHKNFTLNLLHCRQQQTTATTTAGSQTGNCTTTWHRFSLCLFPPFAHSFQAAGCGCGSGGPWVTFFLSFSLSLFLSRFCFCLPLLTSISWGFCTHTHTHAYVALKWVCVWVLQVQCYPFWMTVQGLGQQTHTFSHYEIRSRTKSNKLKV